MAKQSHAQPRLSTLVENIKSNSKLMGEPIRQKDMAAALHIGETYFSSLIKWDREGKGEDVPDHIIPDLRKKYKRYLGEDAKVHVKSEKEALGIILEKLTVLESDVSMALTGLKMLLPATTWEKLLAANEQDKEQRLDATQAKGRLS